MYARSVPCCAGIRSIGIGTSGKSTGIGSGMIPNIAYLAQIIATRASIGMAGNGSPLQSSMSITFVRSSPVTVTVPGEPPLPAWTSTLVITPSKSGCGWPLSVTTSITRNGGVPTEVLWPAAMMKMVLSSDFDENWKLSWKPLGDPAAVVTVTLSSASMTTRGAGTGTTGPMSSVIWIPLASIGRSGDAFGEGDPQCAPEGLDQLVGAHRAVRVADPPVLLRIAEMPRREVVEPVSGHDAMLDEEREALGGRHEAAPHVRDHRPVGQRQRRRRQAVIPARRRKDRRRERVRLQESLDRVHQSMPPMPSVAKLPAWAFVASRSLVCR